jgi:hypothetical protein
MGTQSGLPRMCDPASQSIRNRFFIGEPALGSLALKLPVEVGWQPHGCFDRVTGAHRNPSLDLRVFLRNANAGVRFSRASLIPRSPLSCRLCVFQYQNRSEQELPVFYQKTPPNASMVFRIQNRGPVTPKWVDPAEPFVMATRRGCGGCISAFPACSRKGARPGFGGAGGNTPAVSRENSLEFSVISADLLALFCRFASLPLANRRHLLYKV